MKNFKNVFILLILLISTSTTFAHALFVETNETGKIGQSQKILIYYKEPSDPKKELIEDWWSDTKDFTLWLVQPDGTKERLSTNQEKDHFTASFLPTQNGNYYVAVHHTVESLAGNTQYQFNASSIVKVGKTEVVSKKNKISDQLLMFKTNSTSKKELSIAIVNDGVALADTYVTVIAPSGWAKELKTNAVGVINITAEWTGLYLFEASVKENSTNQEHTKRERIITTTVIFK
jgi:hypothetical protein